MYQDVRDEWRWQLVHDNGNIIADSGEGYKRQVTAKNGIESVQENASNSEIEILE
ncbi:YegP family protein [Haladaptatus sp. DFWS20]|uniref:YegP family protein n=1 Tax=Haladaptatus sp. DFWS20 TaxID=3403467 RepID=UPI003EB708F2